MKVSIRYLEKPATEEEVAIASILTAMLRMLSQGDINQLATLYLVPNQKEALAQEVVKTGLFKGLEKNLPYTRAITFDDVVIRVKEATAAAVFLTRQILLISESRPRISDRIIRLKKIDNHWKILI